MFSVNQPAMAEETDVMSHSAAPRFITRTEAMVVVIGVVACLCGIWAAGRDGLSRLYAESAKQDHLLAPLDQAVSLNPLDPEVRYSRAYVLTLMGRHGDAARELESAVALRPSDFVFWSTLGEARERSGDNEGALAAYQEAVRLAPYYAQPRRYLGTVLLRLGRKDEAFAELRRAVESQPALLSELTNLAWEAYGGDAQAVLGTVQPQSGPARMALARFLVKHEKVPEALDLFRATGGVADEDRQALVSELLTARRFTEAREVWSGGSGGTGRETHSSVGRIIDGSFEGSLIVDNPGFGWRVAGNTPALSVALDTSEPRAGVRSLRLEFSGNSDPNSPVISQAVLVEPNTRYRLAFAARTQDVVTGGSPLVTVSDANTREERTLALSQPLPQGTSVWRDYVVEFMAPVATRAVLIRVQRQNCTTGPCPIFGNIWFDDFSLQRL